MLSVSRLPLVICCHRFTVFSRHLLLFLHYCLASLSPLLHDSFPSFVAIASRLSRVICCHCFTIVSRHLLPSLHDCLPSFVAIASLLACVICSHHFTIVSRRLLPSLHDWLASFVAITSRLSPGICCHYFAIVAPPWCHYFMIVAPLLPLVTAKSASRLSPSNLWKLLNRLNGLLFVLEIQIRSASTREISQWQSIRNCSELQQFRLK